MSTTVELRVADCLSLIKDHVLRKGLDHPEGLTVTLPMLDDSCEEVTVVVHIHTERTDVIITDQTIDLSEPRRIGDDPKLLFDLLSKIGKD